MMPIEQSDWYRAFPKETSRKVVGVLKQVWNELATGNTGNFNPKKAEPKLTELLCEQIKLVCKERTKLTGQWTYEHRFGKVTSTAEGEKVVQRRRADIQYFSDATNLNLVFEFKKLDHTPGRRKVYAGADGMLRFITGDYADGHPVAIMAAILTKAAQDCVPPLEKYLQSADTRIALFMTAYTDGSTVVCPSALFPDDSAFDTAHRRSAAKAPTHGYITISHVVLDFPGLPSASGKTKHKHARSRVFSP